MKCRPDMQGWRLEMQKHPALNPMEMNMSIVKYENSKQCGGPVKMSGQHAWVAAETQALLDKPVKMSGRHAGVAARDAKTLHLGQ